MAVDVRISTSLSCTRVVEGQGKRGTCEVWDVVFVCVCEGIDHHRHDHCCLQPRSLSSPCSLSSPASSLLTAIAATWPSSSHAGCHATGDRDCDGCSACVLPYHGATRMPRQHAHSLQSPPQLPGCEEMRGGESGGHSSPRFQLPPPSNLYLWFVKFASTDAIVLPFCQKSSLIV